MLPGEGRCPMPCWDANGLLPGRGPPGRAGCEPPSDGRGAGRAPVAGEPAGGAAGAAAAADGATAGAGAAAGATGVAGAGAGAAAGGGEAAAGPGRGPPEGRAGPGVAAGRAGAAALPSAASASRSLRATGGSMVDEGLLTNSPSSFSFASATLLSTPSSEAISCTRGFATASPVWGLTRTGQTVTGGRVSFRAVHFASIAVQPFLDGLRVQISRHAQCPHERPPAHRSVCALRCGVEPCAPPGKPRAAVDHEDPLARDEPDQVGAGCAGTTSHARSYRFHATPGRTVAARQPSSTESGWMSILAPVSFAARRAFWPSLPIASDNW